MNSLNGQRGKRLRIILFAVVLALLMCMVEKADIYGDSMRPLLHDGDCVLVEKLSYVFGSPKRFDVVVFRYQREENRLYAKRIIGLPGETVQIIEGEVYIDGSKLEEPGEYEEILNPGRAILPATLGEDEYFLLGDNRNHSADSRSFDIGNVKRDALIGRVFLRLPF